MPTKSLPSIAMRYSVIAILLLIPVRALLADDGGRPPISDNFGVLHQPTGDWYEAGDAMLNPDQNRLLVGKPGTGVLVNGKTGRANSLVTKQTYQDVQVHVEFMVAKGSNSGVIFHGNYEIQILVSAHSEKPTGAHCGGVYPRAEGEPGKPSYRHIDAGSPPRVNAAKPPGQWQVLDIIFQSPRFDEAGNKTANARFVKVVHNGSVVQENHEMPHAHGPNWDRKQSPTGRVVLQGDYGPIAFRNIRVRPWKAGDEGSAEPQDMPAVSQLNVPPQGFTSLFNGRDFTGWKMSPRAKQMWSIEDGVLKSHGLLEQWGADLVTEKEYQDYVLMVDFRMPALSDSGIHFRNLAPAMLGKMGDAEQFNIHPKGGMGHLESFRFVPESMELTKDQLPKVKHVDPEVGVWHTITLTVVGKNVTAELDGEVILDHFEYPDGMLKAGPNPIRFQKHRFTVGAKPGARNPCPIEFRNIFIKEIKPSESGEARGLNVPPEGFTALFNGKDFTGWHTPTLVKQYWSIEDGVLKSPALLERWGADLATQKHYRDFILMLDFRMPTISDSGINFRRLIPKIPGFGSQEQFNLRSKGGFGHLESYYFLPKETAEKFGLKESDKPYKQVRNIDPEVGVWHTVKLTMKGLTFSAEYDGEVIQDNFVYHDWMLNMEPAPIRLQKHIVTYGNTDMGRNLGEVNPCPIEYRNIFIKELGPGDVVSAASSALPIPHPVSQWKWSAEADAEGAKRKAIPIKISRERTIYVATITASDDEKPLVVLLPDSRLSVSGRLATECPVYFGITINHPNGAFAGRFQTVYPADEFRGGEDFEVTLDLQDFQLDPSLAGRKDELPSEPFHFVVETVWLHTLEKQAGLEIAEVGLEPRKTQNTRK
ncbi:MAG: DUF1080 domain-containing protein [Pirellulaceae bacterium]